MPAQQALRYLAQFLQSLRRRARACAMAVKCIAVTVQRIALTETRRIAAMVHLIAAMATKPTEATVQLTAGIATKRTAMMGRPTAVMATLLMVAMAVVRLGTEIKATLVANGQTR